MDGFGGSVPRSRCRAGSLSSWTRAHTRGGWATDGCCRFVVRLGAEVPDKTAGLNVGLPPGLVLACNALCRCGVLSYWTPLQPSPQWRLESAYRYPGILGFSYGEFAVGLKGLRPTVYETQPPPTIGPCLVGSIGDADLEG